MAVAVMASVATVPMPPLREGGDRAQQGQRSGEEEGETNPAGAPHYRET